MNKRTFLGSLAALCATGLGLAKEKTISDNSANKTIKITGPKFEWIESTYENNKAIQKENPWLKHKEIDDPYDRLINFKENAFGAAGLKKYPLEEMKKIVEKRYIKYFGNRECVCLYSDSIRARRRYVRIYPKPLQGN